MGFIGTACFGEFQLTRKIYQWNESVVEGRFVQTLLFYAMNIIPVYGVGATIDFFILNLIEFWSGSNPMAMEPGESEEIFLTEDGVQYRLRATHNQFELLALDGDRAGEEQVLRFAPDSKTWYLECEGQSLALMQFEGEQSDLLRVFSPLGDLEYALKSDCRDDVAEMYGLRAVHTASLR